MKKRTFCLILLLAVSLLAACGKKSETKLIIASDLHLLAPELNSDGTYFSVPSSGQDGKMTHYSNEIADAFFAEVLEQKPQLLILSGDLTMSGAVASHKALAEKLTAVQESGVAVAVIAGNHDVDGVAVDYSGDTLQRADALTSDGWEEIYGKFGLEQAISRDDSSYSYILELSPALQLVMLDTNCYGQNFVKDGTLLWLEEQLKKAQEQNITVLAVSHQNLYAHSELLSFGYQLYNAEKLQKLYETYGVVCNFSGHIHVQSVMDEAVPEVAVGAASVSPLNYGVISLRGKTLQYETAETDVAARAKETGSTDPNLLHFADYAREHFLEISRLKVLESFAESSLTEQEKRFLPRPSPW